MKYFSSIMLACALAVPALAQDSTTNAAPEAAKPAAAPAPGQTFPASVAVLTAPLVLTNDYFYLASDQAEITNGGRAVITFTTTNAGKYEIETLVNAPDESSNSFFVNIDADPADPDMIWDIAVTSGFEKRMVNWRGSGDSGNDEFTPKRFDLKPGEHKLNIVGREPGTLLRLLTVRPAPAE